MTLKSLLLYSMAALMVFFLSGCSILPLQAEIKPDHFRFENFKRDKSGEHEYLYLMCSHKKPVSWNEPSQYLAGKHNLWVRASIFRPDIIDVSRHDAMVNFQLNLESGKSYMLNRQRQERDMTIWIQEVETGKRVSDVKVVKLKRPMEHDDILQSRKCRNSTV